MQALIALFVEGLPSYLARLQQSEADKDLAGLQDLAHQLKGSAASFGFPEITELAKALEKALKAKQPYNNHLAGLLHSFQQILNPNSL